MTESQSVSQYVLVSSTLVGLATRYYFLSECCCLKFAVLCLWGRPLSREDGSAICSVITQWSESRRTRNNTLPFHLRLPQPGGPGSRIYIPQEQGGPVIPPGTGLPTLLQMRKVPMLLVVKSLSSTNYVSPTILVWKMHMFPASGWMCWCVLNVVWVRVYKRSFSMLTF
jgi:hypothetical protein